MKATWKTLAAVMLSVAIAMVSGCKKNTSETPGNDNGNVNGGGVDGGDGDLGNYAWVDLGLPSGILWATCNVGANTLKEYGDFFAWGETTPKDIYNWDTYKYCNVTYLEGWPLLTKYCNDPEYGYNGFTDNLTVLEPIDDAATMNWGNGWRMPSVAEWEELNQNTTYVWVTQNGVAGRLYTASNGNSLFFPVYYDYGPIGTYMLSSLGTHFGSIDPFSASVILISDDPVGVEFSNARCNAWSVRAVHDGNGVGATQSEVHITTSTPQEITFTTAICGCDVVVTQGLSFAEMGVCWSTESNPTADGLHMSTLSWDEPFVCTLTGLEPNTQYYVRAYALHGSEYYYGDEKGFITEEVKKPSISVLQEEGFVHSGDVVNLDKEFQYGFYMASNVETGKELKTLVINIDDNEFEIIDLTGLTEYTYIDVITFSYGAKEIRDVNILATVTDVDGNSASASIGLLINIPAQPLFANDFEWVKQGNNVISADEMATYGLQWGPSYKEIFVTLQSIDGARLYVCNGDNFENITTDVEKAAYFVNLMETSTPVGSYRNITMMASQDYNDMLALIDPNGELHLIHIMHTDIQTSSLGTRIAITGEVK